MALLLIGEYLNGLKLFQLQKYNDHRGYFIESFKKSDFDKFGIKDDFIQDNHSKSQKGVIRGLHFQWKLPQGKLIRVISGAIQIVELDIRHNSPTFGKVWTDIISERNSYVLWVPPGFANGFQALEDGTHVYYKCTAEYNKFGESGINPLSQELNINWQIKDYIISDKDSNAQNLSDWLKREESNNFKF